MNEEVSAPRLTHISSQLSGRRVKEMPWFVRAQAARLSLSASASRGKILLEYRKRSGPDARMPDET